MNNLSKWTEVSEEDFYYIFGSKNKRFYCESHPIGACLIMVDTLMNRRLAGRVTMDWGIEENKPVTWNIFGINSEWFLAYKLAEPRP